MIRRQHLLSSMQRWLIPSSLDRLKALLTLSIMSIAVGCGDTVTKEDEADLAGDNAEEQVGTLVEYLGAEPATLTEEEARILDGEIATVLERLSQNVVRIGKLQVRLWRRSPDHPDKSDFHAFMSPEEVTYHQEQFVQALKDVDNPRNQASDFVFEGCETTGHLQIVGKGALDPSPEAVKECGFLVQTPPEGRLRQFEFLVDEDGYQIIKVTTDIFQRPALFRARRPLGDLAVVIARENSWKRDPHAVRPIIVHSNFNASSATGIIEARELKRVLDLQGTPENLADASKRWYDRQINIEARKPVAASGAAAALMTFGVGQMITGGKALLLAASGKTALTTATGQTILTATTAAAQNSSSWVLTAGGLWKLLSGAAVVTQGITSMPAVNRHIDLIADPRARARAQFAMMLVKTGAAVIGLADIVVSSPLFFKLLAKQYIGMSARVRIPSDIAHSTLEPLASGASKISAAHQELIRNLHTIRFSFGNMGNYFKAMAQGFAKHGKAVREGFVEIGNGHRMVADALIIKREQAAVIKHAIDTAENALVFKDLATKGVAAYKALEFVTDELIGKMAWDYMDRLIVLPEEQQP